MPTIICLVGLSNSGKSRWAHQEKLRLEAAEVRCEIICRDDIHKELHGKRYDSDYNNVVSSLEVLRAKRFFGTETYTVGKRTVKGLGCNVVIIDACHHKKTYRWRWAVICQREGWDLRFEVLNTPVEECLRRARAKGDDYIIPVIERQAREFEPLTGEEL